MVFILSYNFVIGKLLARKQLHLELAPLASHAPGRNPQSGGKQLK
jgi:hypothetical protein